MIDPRQVAWDAVHEMIEEGLKKHTPDGWRGESQNMHLDKCIRHILTYRLIRDGNSPADGEQHLRNALCRLAMGLTQELSNGAET